MRYKLIKEYPGSPPLNTIVRFIDGWYYTDDGTWNACSSYVDDNPEFWQPEQNWTSKLTNSSIGSIHWLNTLGGRILRIGEYMAEFPSESFEYQVRYGQELANSAREIMDYFKSNKSIIDDLS